MKIEERLEEGTLAIKLTDVAAAPIRRWVSDLTGESQSDTEAITFALAHFVVHQLGLRTDGARGVLVLVDDDGEAASVITESGVVPLPKRLLCKLESTGSHLIWLDTSRGRVGLGGSGDSTARHASDQAPQFES